jgi:enoyl-CoA hydratase/carnithine racemase
MADQLVTYELDGAVAVIGLNRADKRNAVNDAVMTQLREAVWRATEEAKAGALDTAIISQPGSISLKPPPG